MNQKTYLGASYLDVAKVAIETFLKVIYACRVSIPCVAFDPTTSKHCTLVGEFFYFSPD